jgi:hypothetical protein
MKNKYIILFILALLPVVLFGQETFKQELSIGINGGIVKSSVSFVPDINQLGNWKLNTGITGRYISEKHFGLQIELNYSQRGWKEDRREGGHYTRNMDYIELPLLTHLYFGKKLRFIINLGPKFGFLLSDKQITDVQILPDLAPYVEPKNKFDYGICAGGGFEFRTKHINYTIEGRYNFGLSDIFSNSRKDIENMMLRSAHRNISINLTLLYSL